MSLTLIVNAKVVTLLILIYDRTKTGEGGGFSPQTAGRSLIPGMAFGVAILLDDVLFVEVVHADLPRNLSGLVTDRNAKVCSPVFPRPR